MSRTLCVRRAATCISECAALGLSRTTATDCNLMKEIFQKLRRETCRCSLSERAKAMQAQELSTKDAPCCADELEAALGGHKLVDSSANSSFSFDTPSPLPAHIGHPLLGPHGPSAAEYAGEWSRTKLCEDPGTEWVRVLRGPVPPSAKDQPEGSKSTTGSQQGTEHREKHWQR